MTELKIGDVVMINSGGPPMTIQGFLDTQSADKYNNMGLAIMLQNKSLVNNGEAAICEWFDNSAQKFKIKVVQISMLKLKA